MRRTMADHSLARPGELVLMGISGGKDSLCMAWLLARIGRSGPVRFRLAGRLVDWEEHAIGTEGLEAISLFMEGLGLEFKTIKAAFPGDRGQARPCYACARERKRLLFTEAAALGARTLALGHNRDDAAATFLMNVAIRGRAEGLPVCRDFFGASTRIIRPLIDVPALSLEGLARRLDLPVVHCPCPQRGQDARSALAPILRSLEGLYPGAKARLARAAGRVLDSRGDSG